MLSRLRERLALVLLVLLPFHALFVTVLTKIIAGPGNAPLPVLALWKEILLAGIMGLVFLEIVREWKVESGKWKIDIIDICIGALILWSLISSFILHSPFSIFNFVLGFKYDFLPLVSFLLLRRVEWSDAFRDRIPKILLFVGAIVASFGILSFFLPKQFFVWLGYSDLHSLYIPGGPLAAFQQIGGTGIRRMQSVMSGPNQLGMWLLIPWSVCVVTLFSRKLSAARPNGLAGRVSCQLSGLLLLIGVAIVLTYSRAVWIAGGVIFVIALHRALPRETFRKILGGSVIVLSTAVTVLLLFRPTILLREASTRDHLARPLEAIQTMISHPLGQGLGTAGPASNRVSDSCVHLEEGSDVSWAESHPELCVFVSNAQVLPTDRTCQCPFLPENWYLQMGVELGVIGFLLYVALVFLILRKLKAVSCQLSASPEKVFAATTFLAFLGVGIAALFLHAWEDSAVAYSLWLLIAVHWAASQSHYQSSAMQGDTAR